MILASFWDDRYLDPLRPSGDSVEVISDNLERLVNTNAEWAEQARVAQLLCPLPLGHR